MVSPQQGNCLSSESMTDIPGSFRAKARPAGCPRTTPPHPRDLSEPLCRGPPVSSSDICSAAQQPSFIPRSWLSWLATPAWRPLPADYGSPWLTCQCLGKAPGHPIPTRIPAARTMPQLLSWDPAPHLIPCITPPNRMHIWLCRSYLPGPLTDASSLLLNECLLNERMEEDGGWPI